MYMKEKYFNLFYLILFASYKKEEKHTEMNKLHKNYKIVDFCPSFEKVSKISHVNYQVIVSCSS